MELSFDGSIYWNKENYSFAYDDFGNALETRVGNVALTDNTYGSNNGLLQNSLYENGDVIKYTYDKMGNVSLIYQKHDTIANFDQYSSYFWLYATDGTPLVHQDGKNQLRYEYVYDSIGRLIRQIMELLTPKWEERLFRQFFPFLIQIIQFSLESVFLFSKFPAFQRVGVDIFVCH